VLELSRGCVSCTPAGYCGVGPLAFTARRPFRPDRLHEAMDLLLDGVVRGRRVPRPYGPQHARNLIGNWPPWAGPNLAGIDSMLSRTNTRV
jgi:hypothetical protein